MSKRHYTTSDKNKQARKKYWATLTPEQRSKRMSAIAKMRHAKESAHDRKALAMRMVAARRKKNS